MPLPRHWTEAADSTIKVMRAEGASWAAIGVALDLSRNTVIERGRRIHAAAPLRYEIVARQAEDRDAIDDPHRPALCAGHELTWRLLTDATVLDGTLYRQPRNIADQI
ncbi:MAG TPA: AsnC family protein [Acetobacteraceae bacterium]|nr:AsnC family protein [Acetobacteraceae bacterium]